MATLERPVDRGKRLGRAALARIGTELCDARTARGLTLAAAARAAAISRSAMSRIEPGQSPMVPFLTLARSAAVVGLDLSLRAYPGGRPFRDAPQLALLRQLHLEAAPSLHWAREVALPIAGDQRAWDATISGGDWTVAVEAETAPRDIQATARRIHLKMRDGGLDCVLLVVRDTRRTRSQLAEAAEELRQIFPVPGRRALSALCGGRRPEGSAIIVLPLPPGGRDRRAPGPAQTPDRPPEGRMDRTAPDSSHPMSESTESRPNGGLQLAQSGSWREAWSFCPVGREITAAVACGGSPDPDYSR